MNQIFEGAFGFYDLANMTQLQVYSFVDQNGKLTDIDITGLVLFGTECFDLEEYSQQFVVNKELDSQIDMSKAIDFYAKKANLDIVNTTNCAMAQINFDIQDSGSALFTGSIKLDSVQHLLRVFNRQEKVPHDLITVPFIVEDHVAHEMQSVAI